MSLFFRYVTPTCVHAYEKLGWVDLGPTSGAHGEYSRTLSYRGDCEEPPEPEGPIFPPDDD